MVKHQKSTCALIPYSVVKNLTVVVIVIVTIIVIVMVVCSLILRPSHQVPSKIETLASNYYENVFYQNMLNSPNYSGDPEKALAPHAARGLSPVTLRQLILNEHLALSSTEADYLLKYCDEEATSIKFYPDPPFSRTAYHTEITYSCNF